MAYISRPPGLTNRAAAISIFCCTWTIASRFVLFSLCRISGSLRHVPIPEHGASTSTLSNFLANRLSFGSASPPISLLSTLCSPALLILNAALSNRVKEVSKARILPLFAINDPMANVLPPAPLQKSAICIPGFASTNIEIIWEPSSWISNKPSRKGLI